MDHLLSSVEAILKFTHGRVKGNRVKLQWIFSGGRAPAERHQVRAESGAVTKRADFGGWVVVPSHGHFHNFPAQALDEEQHFEIKTESFGALQLKSAPG